MFLSNQKTRNIRSYSAYYFVKLIFSCYSLPTDMLQPLLPQIPCICDLQLFNIVSLTATVFSLSVPFNYGLPLHRLW